MWWGGDAQMDGTTISKSYLNGRNFHRNGRQYNILSKRTFSAEGGSLLEVRVDMGGEWGVGVFVSVTWNS